MKTLRRRSSGGDGDGPHWFDDAEAARAVAFIEQLCCFDDGSPFVLQPWQKDFVRKLFGTRRRDNGCRRYRVVFMSMGRGNGKTPLAAACMAFLMFAGADDRALIFSAAADRDQAALALTDAKNFVSASPALSSRAEVLRGSVVLPARGSAWRVLSREAASKHGLRPLGVLFDELHTQKSRDLWDAMWTARGKRPNSLIFAVTTAGFDRNSICFEVYDHARKVRDGALEDPEFLSVIYEPDEGDDWREPATWAKANPNLGVTVSDEFLRSECVQAIEVPASQNRFRRLYLNEWTEQDVRAIDMNQWAMCGGPLDIARLQNRRCWVALDLSSKLDVTCAAVVFEPEEDGVYDMRLLSWIPEENMTARIRRDRVPFDAWVRDGWVEATPGNVVDYDYIRKRVNELREIHDVQEVAIDPWNAAQIGAQLGEDGFTVVEYPQQYSRMSEPTQMFIALIGGKKIRHGDNPVFRWMASNVVLRTNVDGLVKPAKNIKQVDRIDGVVAAIMGLGRALVGDQTGVPRISRLA